MKWTSVKKMKSLSSRIRKTSAKKTRKTSCSTWICRTRWLVQQELEHLSRLWPLFRPSITIYLLTWNTLTAKKVTKPCLISNPATLSKFLINCTTKSFCLMRVSRVSWKRWSLLRQSLLRRSPRSSSKWFPMAMSKCTAVTPPSSVFTGQMWILSSSLSPRKAEMTIKSLTWQTQETGSIFSTTSWSSQRIEAGCRRLTLSKTRQFLSSNSRVVSSICPRTRMDSSFCQMEMCRATPQ